MLIYPVRHGIAVPRNAVTQYDDASRELTDKGIDRMRRIVRGLAAIGVELDEIWSSPLVRARQTAELLAEIPGFTSRVRTFPPLAPGGDLHNIVDELQHFDRQSSVALVGHEPDLGELTALLLTGKTGDFIPYKKGGIACVEVNAPGAPVRGELQWLLTPKQMRSMG